MHKKKRIIEEVFNSITHGFGVLFSLVGLIIITTLHTITTSERIGTITFGLCLITAYLMSTLFHSLKFTKAQKVFQILDHSAIYLLIAGSYTPFVLLALHGTIQWVFLSTIWIISIAGITSKAVFRNQNKWISLALYLILGWSVVIIISPVMHTFSKEVLLLLLGGGLWYTIGTPFYCFKKIPFNHTFWHFFVLIGSMFHFFALYQLLHYTIV